MPTRRNALRFCGVAIGAGLAGCAALGRRSEPSVTRLGELEVINHDFRSYTVHALFVEESEPTYWDSIEATPADDERNSVGGGTFDEYPTEPGDALLYAWRDGQSTTEWESFEFREYDTPCLGVWIMVGAADHENPGEISFWKSTSSNVCNDD